MRVDGSRLQHDRIFRRVLTERCHPTRLLRPAPRTIVRRRLLGRGAKTYGGRRTGGEQREGCEQAGNASAHLARGRRDAASAPRGFTLSYETTVRESLGARERLSTAPASTGLTSLKAWLALILLFWCLIGIRIFVSMMRAQGDHRDRGHNAPHRLQRRACSDLHASEISLHNVAGVELVQGLGRPPAWPSGACALKARGNDFVELPEIANPIGLSPRHRDVAETRFDAHRAGHARACVGAEPR